MVRVGGSTRLLGKILPPRTLPPQDMIDLLGGIYETLLREDHWPEVLKDLAELFGAADAAFVEWTAGLHEVRYFISARNVYTLEAEALYLNHYGLLDTARKLAAGVAPGGAANCVDFFPDSFVFSDEYYQGFLLPLNLRYRCAIKVLDEPDASAAFFLFRSLDQGPFDYEHMQLLGHLDPHLRRLAKLHYEMRRLRAERSEALDLLDRMSFGMVTVTSDGRVRTVNRLAGQYLLDGDGVRLARGSIEASTPAHTGTLRAMIATACEPAKQGRSRESATQLPRPSGKPPFVIAVSPCRGETSLAPSIALISISNPETAASLSGRRLIELYDLTQAEALVACNLADGRSANQIATMHGVAMTTVRTQVAAVLRKCGVRRQADLVRLLSRISAAGA